MSPALDVSILLFISVAAALASLSAGLLGLGGGVLLAPLLLAGSPFRHGPLLDVLSWSKT